MNTSTLSGKTILVTGASSGLGAHFCAYLKSQGARVIGLARRDLSGDPNIDLALQADVTNPQEVQRVIDAAFGAPGSREVLYGLVNNAGIAVTAALHETAFEDEARVIATNLVGTTNMIRSLVPHLRATALAGIPAADGKGGAVASGASAASGAVIVNIASVLGERPLKNVATYAATKAAVIQMTRSSALELARDQIRVNALAPGYVKTDINADVLSGPAGDALMKKTPLRRFAELAELDAPLHLLLDPTNSYMTGAVLLIDGGMSAGL